MKKIAVLLVFLGLFVVGTDVFAASIADKGTQKGVVVQTRHGGPGGGHGGGPGMGAAKGGHHGMRPSGGPGGGHVRHHAGPGVRPIVHHPPKPHRIGHGPRHPRVYVGGRIVRHPYLYDCINPLGFYDPYYCGYYAPALRFAFPNVGVSIGF